MEALVNSPVLVPDWNDATSGVQTRFLPVRVQYSETPHVLQRRLYLV